MSRSLPVLCFLALLAAPAPVRSQGSLPGLEDLRRQLNAEGFVVQEGRFGFLDLEKCRESPSCAGNNPLSPYGLLYLPPAPGEVRSEACEGLASLDGAPGLCGEYRLRPDEAVILVGTTPGECRYFSLANYLYGRFDPVTGKYEARLASLGDALNQLDLATSGTPGGTPGSPFRKATAIVSTADRGVDLAVRRALERAGVPRSIMNTSVLPSQLPLQMGTGPRADRFAYLFRVAEFSRDEDRVDFLEKPDLRVLRVTPIKARRLAPYPTPGYLAHGTGAAEADLAPGLRVAQAALVKRLEGAHPQHMVRRLPTVPAPFLQGDRCIEGGYNCLGDNPDTTYTIGALGQVLGEDPRDFIMVVGIDHHALAKATYVGLSVMNLEKLLGVASVTDRQLAGSGRARGANGPHADLLYAWKIARHCDGDPHCLEVPYEFPGVPAGKPINLVERAYLEADTGVAPAYDELVLPVFLRFTPR